MTELERMTIERTCPPIDLIEQGGRSIEEHLKSCKFCRSVLANANVVNSLDKQFPVSTSTVPGKAGQIRVLLRKAVNGEIHDKHGWHNCPLVLLLQTNMGTDRVYQVAQIHDSAELSAKGDVAIPDTDLYAESWNVYPAFLDSMSAPVFTTSDHVVDFVTKLSREKRFVPDTGSDKFLFRRLELNIGGYFGQHALARVFSDGVLYNI